MLYIQPLATQFGSSLVSEINSEWNRIDVAVAWVRSTGLAHIKDPLQRFLGRGGSARFVVGVDLQNTTYEGLHELLALERFGSAETYVYHNESGSIFHPKLYLFRTDANARLIIGSNNLTEAGLFTNVEAGLQLDRPITDQLIIDALIALQSWSDVSDPLVKKLDTSVLNDLKTYGYVPDEGSVNREMGRRYENRRSKGTQLFGVRRYKAPRSSHGHTRRRIKGAVRSVSAKPGPTTTPTGNVLLLRLRKASASNRPTQTQIPVRVVNQFFGAHRTVRSQHSHARHDLRDATARGKRNTVKLEIPEMKDFDDPVARFERRPWGIVYEVYDASSPQGGQIMKELQSGIVTNDTKMTLPSQPDRSTWWRLV